VTVQREQREHEVASVWILTPALLSPQMYQLGATRPPGSQLDPTRFQMLDQETYTAGVANSRL